MSVRNLFRPLISLLQSAPWGARIEDRGGTMRDTAVTPLAESIVAGARREGPIDIFEPWVINNHTNGPGIIINNVGSAQQNQGIQVQNESGQGTMLGIGAWTTGVVASELLPLVAFAVDPATANAIFRTGSLPMTIDGTVDPGFVSQVGPQVGSPSGGGAPGAQGPPNQIPGFVQTPSVSGSNPYPYPQPSSPILPIASQLLAAMSSGGFRIIGGCGIEVSGQNGRTVSARVDDVTIACVDGELTAKDGGIGPTQLNASVAGGGLSGGGGAALSVNVGCGLEIDSDNVKVKRADLLGVGLKAGASGCQIAVDTSELGGVTGTITVPDPDGVWSGTAEIDPDTCEVTISITVPTKQITVEDGLITDGLD